VFAGGLSDEVTHIALHKRHGDTHGQGRGTLPFGSIRSFFCGRNQSGFENSCGSKRMPLAFLLAEEGKGEGHLDN